MEKILRYLNELETNNNREWFGSHKELRDSTAKEFENLLQDLIFSIGKNDESILHNTPKELVFKQVRDTRFRIDKTPYIPAYRAHIASQGKLPIPVGYFIFVMPNNRSFLGGGLFADIFKDATSMIRDYISLNGDEFESIINDKKFKMHFEIKGEKLKKVPASYDEKSKWSEYLKYKNIYIEHFITDEQLLKNDFVEKATEIFLLMKPLNDFFNKALKKFIMPSRPQ